MSEEKNGNWIDGVLKGVNSHINRAEEGHRLLSQGRPLSEMTTPIEGATEEQLLERRNLYLNRINGMDDETLNKHLKNIEFQLQRILKDRLVGSSELEWQRNQILMLMEQRRHTK